MQANEGRIRVSGPDPASHRVPAEVLARTIEGLQESALILAALREGHTLAERFRPSAELRQKYTIEVGPPEKGSVAVSFALVDKRVQPALPVDGTANQVISTFYTTLRYISTEAYDELRQSIPDSRWRDRLLRSFGKFLPESGASWQLGFAAADQPEVTVAAKEAAQLLEAVEGFAESTSVMAVTGTLTRVDFESNQLWIKHLKTNKLIECNYLPEIEEELVNARRDKVQVIGEFTLDDAGFPTRLSNVSSVRALNLSEITLTEVVSDGLTLRVHPALVLVPQLDAESTQLLEVEFTELNLHAFAYTREELIEEVEASLVFLWRSFVQDDLHPLSSDASELRERLLARLSEVHNA